MSPYLAVANLDDGSFAILAIDPTSRDGDRCTAIVQSIHQTRAEAEAALAQPKDTPA